MPQSAVYQLSSEDVDFGEDWGPPVTGKGKGEKGREEKKERGEGKKRKAECSVQKSYNLTTVTN